MHGHDALQSLDSNHVTLMLTSGRNTIMAATPRSHTRDACSNNVAAFPTLKKLH